MDTNIVDLPVPSIPDFITWPNARLGWRETTSPPMTQLRRLAPPEQERLRASLVITSIAQCVRELVQNSLDAGASTISIRVHCSEWHVSVSDDGAGIPSASMPLVGDPYTSSKSNEAALDALGSGATHGFRGEALSAIGNISLLTIISCAHGDVAARKITRYGTCVSVDETVAPQGTTVTVRELFGALPVRRKSAPHPTIAMEQVRRAVEEAVLGHPGVSFLLFDIARDARVISTRPVRVLFICL